MSPRRGPGPLLAALILPMALVVACSGESGESGESGDSGPPTPSASVAPSSAAPDTEESPAESAPGFKVRPTFFGMHDGRVSQGITPDAAVGALRFWDSGTSWLHLETSPGVFTWDALDTAVAAAKDAGARPLLVLGQTPTFHASRPEQEAAYGPGAASMPDLAAWRRYVAAVAGRYGNQIDYQVWNEANIVGYWAGTPRQMAQLTVTASRAIRQAVPKATVVAPAFALRLPSQQRYFTDYWSLQSRTIDLTGAVDAVSVHLYPPAEGLPEAQVGLLESARKVLGVQGVDLPVWNTEINFGLLGGPEPPTIPEERQRAFLMRTYLLNAGLGVERVYWYSWNIGRIANTYLTEEDLTTETPAGRSYDVVRDWLVGSRIEGCGKSKADPRVWECVASKGGRDVAFWWKPRGAEKRVSVDGAASWTDADGTVTRCREACRVRVAATPVMIELGG